VRGRDPTVQGASSSPAEAPAWLDLSPVARGLIAVRTLRSVGQGLLVVDFVLYLKALHWSAAAIGALLTLGALVGAALTLAVGPLSDRYGRRRFLLLYQALTAAGAAAIMLWPSTGVLVAASSLLGLGRGANGTAGPFGPAEQAWLAQVSRPQWRGWVFSLNSGLAFAGMGVGALLAAAVGVTGLSGAAMYRPLFGAAAVVALANGLQLRSLREAPRTRRVGASPQEGPPREDPAGEAALRRRENTALLRLALINGVNSLGIGLMGPLLPYWFASRFGLGPATIGPIYALTFFLTAASSLATGVLAQRVGLVRSVVWTRLAGVALLAALPLMPNYALAALAYVVRSMLNRGSTGARQAFGVGLVRDARRGWAASVNALSFRLPSAVGPALTGWLFSAGDFALPFVLAAGLQLAYAVLFGRVMGAYGAPGEGEA
jgi:MFS family permease